MFGTRGVEGCWLATLRVSGLHPSVMTMCRRSAQHYAITALVCLLAACGFVSEAGATQYEWWVSDATLVNASDRLVVSEEYDVTHVVIQCAAMCLRRGATCRAYNFNRRRHHCQLARLANDSEAASAAGVAGEHDGYTLYDNMAYTIDEVRLYDRHGRTCATRVWCTVESVRSAMVDEELVIYYNQNQRSLRTHWVPDHCFFFEISLYLF